MPEAETQPRPWWRLLALGVLNLALWGAAVIVAGWGWRDGSGQFLPTRLAPALTATAVTLLTIGGLITREKRLAARDREASLQARKLRRRFDRLFQSANAAGRPRSATSGMPTPVDTSTLDPAPFDAAALDASSLLASPEELFDFAADCDLINDSLLRTRAREELISSAIDNLDSGVMVIDLRSQVLMANPAARRFFSISRDPVGHPLLEAIRQPELVEAVRLTTADQSPREVIVDLLDGSGVRRVLRVLVATLARENATAILIAARDETEARQVEEMRREFVANASHELKTPLAAIKGYAETVELAIEDDPEAALRFVGQIREQCQRLERLVADLITLARAQAGSQHLRFTAVDLHAVIRESIATYTPVAAAKRIRLDQSDAADAPHPLWVHVDREATLTIVNNLIGNAVRYTPEGGTVNASASTAEGFAVIRVQDNGIGIARSDQQRVFERFYRTEVSKKMASAGTGLGLAIVKNLTQAQGGKVRVRSQTGVGSTFEVLLPLEPSKHHPPAINPAINPPAKRTAPGQNTPSE